MLGVFCVSFCGRVSAESTSFQWPVKLARPVLRRAVFTLLGRRSTITESLSNYSCGGAGPFYFILLPFSLIVDCLHYFSPTLDHYLTMSSPALFSLGYVPFPLDTQYLLVSTSSRELLRYSVAVLRKFFVEPK